MADEKNPFGGTSLPLDGNAGGRVMRVDGDVLFQGNVEIRAGRFIAATETSMTLEPTDIDFSGCFMSAEGETFGDDLYNIGGVNAGVLQFGLSSTTGKAMFGGGAVIADIDGLTSTGLRTGLAQLATAGGATRFGVLEMFVPQGGTIPAFGMSLSDNDDPTANVCTNGDFETGDLTGWTQTGTAFSVEAGESGGYHLACAEITGADEEIVSDRIAVTEDSILAISVKTKDVLTATSATLHASEDTYLNEEAKTTNYGSEASLLTEFYLDTPTTRKRPILRFDFSTLPTGVTNKPNFNAEYLAIYVNSITAADFVWSSGQGYLVFNALLKNWVEAQATWNLFATGSAWTTAGALGDGTDYANDSSVIGITTLAEGWNNIALSQTMMKSYISGTTYKGLVLRILMENCEFSFDSSEGTNPPELYLTWDEPPDYEVVIRWYDDASAGSLLRTDVVAVEDNLTDWNTHTANLSAPAGALSACVAIVAHAGQPFYIDDVSVVVTTVLERIFLKDDGAYYQGSASSGVASRLALASEIPATVYPDYFIGNGALLQMYDSSNNRKALTVTVINANTYGGMAGYSAAAVAANGDYYLLTIPLRAGTYSFNANYTKNTDYGKFDLYVGATKVSGATPLDCYASSVSNNKEWAITGITIAADGWYTFKILNVGKNSSSADYRLWVGAITIFRTA